MKQNIFFKIIVEVQRIRVGERQTIETLINEEALLFAKYLRKEKNGDQELLSYSKILHFGKYFIQL